MKIVKGILLLVVIGITFGFAILRLAANGSENNFFNQQFRTKFSASELFRNILSLHNDGDAKSDYLGSKFAKIQIEVDEAEGQEIPKQSLDLLAEKISEATGKPTTYFISDSHIPAGSSLSYDDIGKIVSTYRTAKNSSDTASLYLLLVSRLGDNKDQIGSTFQEFGVVIFGSTLHEYINNREELLPNYLESTALHEFGHQIGLPHNDFSDCLMQAVVDSHQGVYQAPESVVTDFCNYEKDLIREQKTKL